MKRRKNMGKKVFIIFFSSHHRRLPAVEKDKNGKRKLDFSPPGGDPFFMLGSFFTRESLTCPRPCKPPLSPQGLGGLDALCSSSSWIPSSFESRDEPHQAPTRKGELFLFVWADPLSKSQLIECLSGKLYREQSLKGVQNGRTLSREGKKLGLLQESTRQIVFQVSFKLFFLLKNPLLKKWIFLEKKKTNYSLLKTTAPDSTRRGKKWNWNPGTDHHHHHQNQWAMKAIKAS